MTGTHLSVKARCTGMQSLLVLVHLLRHAIMLIEGNCTQCDIQGTEVQVFAI